MPKMKTHSGAAKRFRFTGKGQVKRAQAHRRHILTKKSTKRKRHLRSDIQRIHKVDVASIKRMLPYA